MAKNLKNPLSMTQVVLPKKMFTMRWLRSCPRCCAFWQAIDLYCESCWDHILSTARFGQQDLYQTGVSHFFLFAWTDQKQITQLIYQLKGGGDPSSFMRIARQFTEERLTKAELQRPVVFVPAPPARVGASDHADQLAKAFSEIWQAPVARLLRREGHRPQKSKTRQERHKMQFKVESLKGISGAKTLIFVDDILTSGATARAACQKFAKKGLKLEVWTMAWRPLAEPSLFCYNASHASKGLK